MGSQVNIGIGVHFYANPVQWLQMNGFDEDKDDDEVILKSLKILMFEFTFCKSLGNTNLRFFR